MLGQTVSGEGRDLTEKVQRELYRMVEMFQIFDLSVGYMGVCTCQN